MKASEEFAEEEVPTHAIPEGPVSVLLKPHKFSWRRSRALLELPDGTRLGVLTTRERGWEHIRIKFAAWIAFMMSTFVSGHVWRDPEKVMWHGKKATLESFFEAVHNDPRTVILAPFYPLFYTLARPTTGGLTLAATAALSRLIFSRRPSFRFEDARGNLLYTADFKRAQEAWVITAAAAASPAFVLRLDRKAREFVLYEDSPQPDEASEAPELVTPLEPVSLRIPALLKQGARFAPSDAKGFVGQVTSVHRLEIPLGARKIRLPDWRSELYTLEFGGQGEAFAPREVLAFATYIVRTVNTIPIDILMLLGLAAGGVGTVQEIVKRLKRSPISPLDQEFKRDGAFDGSTT